MRKTTPLALLAALLIAAPLASAGHSVSISNASEAAPGTYTIDVDVSGFQLVDFTGRDAKKGEGHIHYLVNGEDACKADKADCAAPTDYATTATSFTFKDLEAGDVIKVVLVLSNHSNSGTDADGRLNGGEVSDTLTVETRPMGIPGFETVAVIAAVAAALLVLRRK